jgi:hypothetical protein
MSEGTERNSLWRETSVYWRENSSQWQSPPISQAAITGLDQTDSLSEAKAFAEDCTWGRAVRQSAVNLRSDDVQGGRHGLRARA